MKYIFDFDDVVLENTKKFKPYMFGVLTHQLGIPEDESTNYYKEKREREFSLLDFITELCKRRGISSDRAEAVYKQILLTCRYYLNGELINLIIKLGTENCYLVTNGDKKFQEDKIEATGIAPLFKRHYVVSGSKKEVIGDICGNNQTEKVIFVEDKEKFLEDIKEKDIPNIVKVHFKEGTGVADLQREIQKQQSIPEIVEIRKRMS
jgi:hypothetical protein